MLDPATPSRLRWGGQLLAFTDAAVGGESASMDKARHNLLAVAGYGSTVRAAACVANFQMMNRILDATGVPVTGTRIALADELGLHVPDHLCPT